MDKTTTSNDEATETASSEVQKKVHADYRKKYRPSKVIDLRLSFDEMQEFLKDKELQEQISIGWQIKFYCKQLFWLSFNQFLETYKPDELLKIMSELEETVRFAKHRETRALVVWIKLSFFGTSISTFDLCQIFDGSELYDDHCAQLAYNEFNRRGGKEDF